MAPTMAVCCLLAVTRRPTSRRLALTPASHRKFAFSALGSTNISVRTEKICRFPIRRQGYTTSVPGASRHPARHVSALEYQSLRSRTILAIRLPTSPPISVRISPSIRVWSPPPDSVTTSRTITTSASRPTASSPSGRMAAKGLTTPSATLCPFLSSKRTGTSMLPRIRTIPSVMRIRPSSLTRI